MSLKSARTIDFTLGVYMLMIPTVVCICLALVGCISVSPGVPNLYLVELQGYQGSIIRMGYFGTCIKEGAKYVCGVRPNVGNINLLNINEESILAIRKKIFIPIIAFAGVIWCIGFLLFCLTKRLQSTRAYGSTKAAKLRSLPSWTHFFLLSGTAFLFVSAYSVTIAARAMAIISVKDKFAGPTVRYGAVVWGLQWTAAVTAGLFSTGAMILLSNDKGKSSFFGANTAISAVEPKGVTPSHLPSLPPPPPPPPPM